MLAARRPWLATWHVRLVLRTVVLTIVCVRAAGVGRDTLSTLLAAIRLRDFAAAWHSRFERQWLVLRCRYPCTR